MEFTRCYGCMRELPAPGAVCPRCGFDNTNDPGKQPSHVLPCGTVLNGQYMVGRSLGQGGFGITYIGWDLNLEIPLCIKEYFPDGAAMRSATQSRLVLWSTSENAQSMKESRKSFVKEAQKAVKLRDLRHVVTVWGVFYENETAYIVMDYIEGETLKSRLVRTQKLLNEAECVELLRPVMEDLEKAHQRGIIHRDIKPDNIMLRANGGPVLLDMGAAKDLGKAAQKSGTLSSTLVVSHGFSPREQYRAKGSIGSWTDVYAMCATIIWCVTGKVPPTPMDRDDGEKIDFHCFSPPVARVLQKGMELKPEDRIQTMGELLAALRGELPDRGKQGGDDGKKPVWRILVPVVAGALLLGAGAYALGNRDRHDDTIIASEAPASTEPTAASPSPSPEITATPSLSPEITAPPTPSPEITAPPSPSPESALETILEGTSAWKDLRVGDTIVFGQYEQDHVEKDGKEPLEWLVLDVQEDRALVITSKVLETMRYNMVPLCTWETCDLRSGLNSGFLAEAFTEEEQQRILETTVTADKNSHYSTAPGNDTVDKVFLLSTEQAINYFPFRGMRKSEGTVQARMGNIVIDETGKTVTTARWWLRTPGSSSSTAAYVSENGSINYEGALVMDYLSYGVRPAMWIRTDA